MLKYIQDETKKVELMTTPEIINILETTNQGITPCPSTHPTSAAGSSSINQCQKQLNWYSTENNLSTSTTCNYNGLITLPETPPSRPGYIFNGWKLKTNNE